MKIVKIRGLVQRFFFVFIVIKHKAGAINIPVFSLMLTPVLIASSYH